MFQSKLQQKDTAGILALADSHMREYIRYFFQLKVVSLSKTKKNELQEILTPLLQQHYDAVAAPTTDGDGGSTPEQPIPSVDEEV